MKITHPLMKMHTHVFDISTAFMLWCQRVMASLWDVVSAPLETQKKSRAQPLTSEQVGTQLTRARAAVSCLGMLASAEPALLDTPAQLRLLTQVCLGAQAADQQAWELARACAYALRSLPALSLSRDVCAGHSWTAAAAAAAAPAAGASVSGRDAELLSLLRALMSMVRGDWDGCAMRCKGQLRAEAWYGAAEQAIELMFVLYPRPERLVSALLQDMAAAAKSSASTEPLSRLLFVAGHSALRLLVHAEATASAAKKARLAASRTAGSSKTDKDG